MTTYPLKQKDPYAALHESLFTPEELAAADQATDEEVTASIRSMGRILDPISAPQRQQLDNIAAFGRRPRIKKQSRRQKKAERRRGK